MLDRRKGVGGVVTFLLILFVLWGGWYFFGRGGGGGPALHGFVGKRSAPTVRVTVANRDFVTFTNQDGSWQFFRRCQGTDTSGVGYIGKFVSRTGWVVSNDYLQGGFGELNNPDHGGIGSFGIELAIGQGGEELRDWNNTAHLSVRRCGPFGATHWSGATFGVGVNAGFYDQDVVLGSATDDRLLRVRYRWRIDPSDVRLYGGVDVVTGTAHNLTAYYAKEPKLVVTLNGQATATPFGHFSTFAADGGWLSEATAPDDRECSYGGANAYKGTGHCFAASRQRVRWDYAASPSGGCTRPRPCFNAVLMALPQAVATGPSLLAGTPRPWESKAGLERWAYDASAQPKAGDDGCVTIEGEPVYLPLQEHSRNWEYASFRNDDGTGYRSSMVMAKGWDGCKNTLDATSLYRLLRPDSYAWFMSVSLGNGWRLH